MRYEGAQITPYKGPIGKGIWKTKAGIAIISVFDHPNDIGGAILGIDRTDKPGLTCFEYPGINGQIQAIREAKKLAKIYKGEV